LVVDWRFFLAFLLDTRSVCWSMFWQVVYRGSRPPGPKWKRKWK
jgi:hypothetical protein